VHGDVVSLHVRLFSMRPNLGYPDKNSPLVGICDDGEGDEADAERDIDVAFHVGGVGLFHCLAQYNGDSV
jgi:hypothetical protein